MRPLHLASYTNVTRFSASHRFNTNWMCIIVILFNIVEIRWSLPMLKKQDGYYVYTLSRHFWSKMMGFAVQDPPFKSKCFIFIKLLATLRRVLHGATSSEKLCFASSTTSPPRRLHHSIFQVEPTCPKTWTTGFWLWPHSQKTGWEHHSAVSGLETGRKLAAEGQSWTESSKPFSSALVWVLPDKISHTKKWSRMKNARVWSNTQVSKVMIRAYYL